MPIGDADIGDHTACPAAMADIAVPKRHFAMVPWAQAALKGSAAEAGNGRSCTAIAAAF